MYGEIMARFSTYLKNIFFLLILIQLAPLFLHNIRRQYNEFIDPKTEVGALTVTGVVYDSSYYTKNLRKFFKNQDIKAILIKIESAGAAAGSAEAIANEINLLKKEFPKPVVCLCENLCTSGSYYIAVAADYIIAPPSALIGSIGTKIPYQFKFNELLETLKIQYIPISAGTYKESTDPFVKATPEQIEHLKEVTNDSYKNFIGHVAKHRPKLTIDSAPQWAEGKIFTARQALKLGLIDELGSLTTSIKKIKEMALIDGDIDWIEPTTSKSFLTWIFGSPTRDSEFAVKTMLITMAQHLTHLLC